MRMSRRSFLAALAAIGTAGCLGGDGGGKSSSDSPTATDSPTGTASATATDSPTQTDSPTATQRSTPTATDRSTPSPTATDSPTPTATATPQRRQTTWTHPDTGQAVEAVVTDVFAPVEVRDVTLQLYQGDLLVHVDYRARERLELVGARATATGDLPTGAAGSVLIDHQDTVYEGGVPAGARRDLSPRVEYHEAIERIEIVLDDRETGANETPTDTPTPCDGFWC